MQIFDLSPNGIALNCLNLRKKVSRWNGSELYSTGMFHGPIFQSIAHIEGWNEEGIDANLSDVSLDGFSLQAKHPN